MKNQSKWGGHQKGGEQIFTPGTNQKGEEVNFSERHCGITLIFWKLSCHVPLNKVGVGSFQTVDFSSPPRKPFPPKKFSFKWTFGAISPVGRHIWTFNLYITLRCTVWNLYFCIFELYLTQTETWKVQKALSHEVQKYNNIRVLLENNIFFLINGTTDTSK